MATFLSVGPNLPSVCVEVDVTNAPTNPTRVWTDITPYIRSIDYQTSGRSTELQRSSTGTCSIVCGNANDVVSNLGIAKRQWIRVRAQWSGVTYPVWQGIVEQLPHTWPSYTDNLIQFTAAGVFKVLRLCPIDGQTFPAQRNDQRITQLLAFAGLPTAFARTVNAFAPSLYWRLGEASGTTAADASGNNRTGTYGAACVLSQPGALAGDADTAVSFPNSATALVTSGYSPFVAGSKRTFMAWANHAAALDSDAIFTDNSAAGPLFSLAGSSTDIGFGPQGALRQVWTNAAPGLNTWFHVALTYDDASLTAELFVNGVSQGTKMFSQGYGASGTFTAGSSTFTWNGLLDEVAVFESILSPFAINAIYNAGLTAGPAAVDVDTDAADAVTTPFSTGSDALSYATQIEESENGLLVETPAGQIVFQGRHYRLKNSTSSLGTFSEFQIPYTDSAQYVDDDALVANTASVTPLGGSAVIWTDSSSQISRWKSYITRSLVSSSATLALAAAQWLVGRYKNPSPRIPQLEVNLAAAAARSSAYVATLLGAAVSNRFTWQRGLGWVLGDATLGVLGSTTQLAGSWIVQDFYVEQIKGKIQPGQWAMQFVCSQVVDEASWVLGDSTYGVLESTTKLAY